MSTFRKFVFATTALSIAFPISVYSIIQIQKHYPQLFDSDAEQSRKNLEWIDLRDREDPTTTTSTQLGIQETHYWAYRIFPDLINTAFLPLNDSEVVMYNIGPLTDEVLQFLKEKKIQKVHHIMCCNVEMEKYLVQWIQEVNMRRDEALQRREASTAEDSIDREGDAANSAVDQDSDADLPQVIHYQFSTQGKPSYRLTPQEKKYIKRIVTQQQLPPILRQEFQFAKMDAIPLMEEVVMLHRRTKTLFTTFLTRHYTDKYKGTPDYNYMKFRHPEALNQLTTLYKLHQMEDTLQFRDFVNEISEWDFENLFMVQGEFIQGNNELPKVWRDTFDDVVGRKFGIDEKL